jgi:glutamyl-tRNA(Gln) amidotransferase subunit E
VGIANILIEEDAARKIKTEDRGRTVYYNLDRLGVPLTEIITDHNDVDNPAELGEAAKMIGLNLRTTDFAMRGIGSVRQDVNISIDGGNRVEIKGIQDLGMLPKWCEMEVRRQQALIEIASLLRERDVKKDDLEHTYIEISHLFNDLGEGDSAYAVRLPSFEDILLYKVQPGKDFGYEVFEKNNLITGLQYDEMFHSGEGSSESLRKMSRPDELFINDEVDREIRKLIRLAGGDGYVAARGPTKPVLHALKKTVERCKQAFDGVPQETRRALANGNNEFLRVIHGKERLYPDTDTPPLPFPLEKYESMKEQVKPRPIELMKKHEGGNLNWTQLTNLIRSESIGRFERMVDEGIPVQLTYHIVHDMMKLLTREGEEISNLTDKVLLGIGSEVTIGNLNREALPDLLRELCRQSDINVQKSMIEKEKSALLTEDQLRSIVKEHVGSLDENQKSDKNAIIGSLKERHGRNMNGRILAKILEEVL